MTAFDRGAPEAAKLLDVEEAELSHFDETDPLNPPNTIAGWVCRRSDHRYGALVIQVVNGVEVAPQVIYGMPKLHYPFDIDVATGERKYHWPVFYEAKSYTKWDGTSCVVYSYARRDGTRFVTAKTRLTPILHDSDWGPFCSMWKELATEHPMLTNPPREVWEGRMAYSYELCGTRNTHLIIYSFPLKAVLLCGIPQTWQDNGLHGVVPPEQLDVPDKTLLNPLERQIDNKWALTALYEELRIRAHDQNKVLDDGTIEGTEGFVLYVKGSYNEYGKRGVVWRMLKCKDSRVEDIHWHEASAAHGISSAAITTTVWNALESCSLEELTYETIKTLLLEEFEEHQIEARKRVVETALERIKEVAMFRVDVVRLYKALPEAVRTDKATVMRALSKELPKSKMQTAYTVLADRGFLPKKEAR